MDSNDSHMRGGIARSRARGGLHQWGRGDDVECISNDAESARTAEPMPRCGCGRPGGDSGQAAGGVAAFLGSARSGIRKALASAGMLAFALVLSASCTYAWFSGTQTGLNRAVGAGGAVEQTGSIVLECHVDKSGGDLPEYVGDPYFGYELRLDPGESDISSVIYKVIRARGEDGNDVLEAGPNGLVYDGGGNAVGSGRLSDFGRGADGGLAVGVTLRDGWSLAVEGLPVGVGYSSSYDPGDTEYPGLFEVVSPSDLEDGLVEPGEKALPYTHIYKRGRGSLEVSKAVAPADGARELEDGDYATLYGFALRVDGLASVEGGVLAFADGSRCAPRLVDVDAGDPESVRAKEARERYWRDHPDEGPGGAGPSPDREAADPAPAEGGGPLYEFSLYPGQRMVLEGLPAEVGGAGADGAHPAAFEIVEAVPEGAAFSPVQEGGRVEGALSEDAVARAPFVNVLGPAGAGEGGIAIEKRVELAEGAQVPEAQAQEPFRFDVSLAEGALGPAEGGHPLELPYILVDGPAAGAAPTTAWLEAWRGDPEGVELPEGWEERTLALEPGAEGGLEGSLSLRHGQGAYVWGLEAGGSVRVEEALTQKQAESFAQPTPVRSLRVFAGMLSFATYANTCVGQGGPAGPDDPTPPGPVDPSDPDNPDDPDGPDDPDDPAGPDDNAGQGGSSAPAPQADPVIRRIRVLAQTGDPAFCIALALLLAAAASIAAALLIRRKRG